MLYFDRIVVSEGIDVNKINKSKLCDICHCWYYFLDKDSNYDQMPAINNVIYQ